MHLIHMVLFGTAFEGATVQDFVQFFHAYTLVVRISGDCTCCAICIYIKWPLVTLHIPTKWSLAPQVSSIN